MSTKSSEVHELLDALYLELLNLIEQQTNCRINIEKLIKSGQLLLAKTRYVRGANTISVAQIPTENSDEFTALCRVYEELNKIRVSKVEYQLEKHAVNKEKGFIEPIHWFGVLAPRSLRMASEQFQKCVELVVESANIQREMVSIMDNIDKLKCIIAK